MMERANQNQRNPHQDLAGHVEGEAAKCAKAVQLSGATAN